MWEVWDVHPAMTERRAARQAPSVVIERRKRDEPRASVPELLREGWLAFECKTERRRLAPIPSGWEGVTDDGLADLLESAISRGRTRRLIE